MNISSPKTAVFSTTEELFKAAANFILTLSKNSDRFSIALSGGSTPKGLFQKMASPEFRSLFAWDKFHFFWGDERWVSHEDPRSNYRMTRETLLDPLKISSSQIHAVPTHENSPEASAAAYERDLRNFFGNSKAFPAFDLVLLGMGEDGHTASLFPGDQALQEEKKWVTTAKLKSPEPRITLTFPVLNQANNVLFLVTGENKRELVHAILKKDPSSANYPAAKISPVSGNIMWMLDQSAFGCTKS